METYEAGLRLFPDDRALQDGKKAAEEVSERHTSALSGPHRRLSPPSLLFPSPSFPRTPRPAPSF